MKIVVAALLSGALAGTAWVATPDPHHPLTGPPGVREWPAAVAAAAPGVAAPDPVRADPAQVSRFFAGLTPGQRRVLAERAPGVVGNLDGVPYELRYTANEHATTAKAPGRLLGYDPRDDGRAVVVFGDIERATRIAVYVPGSGWRFDNVLSTKPGSPCVSARALHDELRRIDARTPTAVIVWLGYDPPEDVDKQAMRSERATEGADDLVRFLAGLPAHAEISVIAHSYGAVVAGHAAHQTRIADLVALAAPGMDADTVDELRTGARVWAARTADDPIRYAPTVRLLGFGHGNDPTDPSFGARVFTTGNAGGHANYFAPGTEPLANLARIVLGRHHEVTLVGH